MNKLGTILLWIIVFIIQFQVIYWNYLENTNDVVIDIQKVFSEFEMKKELEQKVKGIEKRQIHVLDSFQLELKEYELRFNDASEAEKIQINEEYKRVASSAQRKKEIMQQEIGMAVENYDDQIWNQLNAYLSDFGKNNGYRIVFSEFDRNILFHQQSLDKTGEAIEYVNARYRGE